MMVVLSYDFFDKECTNLAKNLLGQILVRHINGSRVSGMIVETESYLGGSDVASHSYNGKRTKRNEPMYMDSGTAYVYPIYGMYHCFNISSKGDGSCVLIRALEPLEGQDTLLTMRQKKNKNPKGISRKMLCNGPSKLCTAFNITKDSCNKKNLAFCDDLFVEQGSYIEDSKIVCSKRIGISSAGPVWAEKLLRFYILGNECVSVRDRKAEELLKEQYSPYFSVSVQVQ